MSSTLPNLNRRGSARKPSTKRSRSKVCPVCGKRFATRTKLQAHLVDSLQQMHTEALELGFDEQAQEIAETLTMFPAPTKTPTKKEQHHGT